MTVEAFFDKFDLFAEAPNAIARIRELVLELAVRGALTEPSISHDPEDVQSEESEEPFPLPGSWRWATLDELGDTRIRNSVPDDLEASFTPMTLIPSGYGLQAKSEPRIWSGIKKGFTHFAEGDVVMAKITPCFENAKSAVMRNLKNGVGAGTTELHVFRPRVDAVLADYVLVYLKSRGFISRGEAKMTGSAGQKRIPHGYFAGSPFPLPPLAEQKRIVEKVDELMALCDQLEAQQTAARQAATNLLNAAIAELTAPR